MPNKIEANELQKAIKEYLEYYEEDIIEGVKQVTESITDKAVTDLKNTSPKMTGDYAKGWRKQKGKINKSSKYTIKIHNKTNYQLTHLLEYGHAKRNGGRVEGKAHIAPAEQQGIRQLQEEIERALRG